MLTLFFSPFRLFNISKKKKNRWYRRYLNSWVDSFPKRKRMYKQINIFQGNEFLALKE